MPYLKRINSLPLINHISYKYAQVSDIGPSWSSCLLQEFSRYKSNSASGCLNKLFKPIRSCDTFKLTLYQNDKILDQYILKAFADDKLIVIQMATFLLYKIENIVGREKNAGYQHFLLFLQCFQKAISLGSLKVGIVW